MYPALTPASWSLSMPVTLRILSFAVLALALRSPARGAEATDSRPAPRDAVAAEYANRFGTLASDDEAGHYKLAEWCQQRRRFDLLAEQCRHVLALKPDHANAKILLDLAEQELAKAEARRRRAQRRGGVAGADVSDRRARLVSDADIQELRFSELHHRRPERVRVKFKNDACNRFAEDMMRDGRFSRADRVTFLRLKPAHRLAWMVEQTGDAYKDDIEIRSDPVVFRVFRRRVLPMVMGGCGSTACHGGVKAPVFRLYEDAAFREASAYTNFLVLDTLRVGDKPLVDRDQPTESLLLQYLFPRELARYRHSTEIDPVVRDERDPKYRTLVQWILQLRFPHFGYDVSWRPPAAPGGRTKAARR